MVPRFDARAFDHVTPEMLKSYQDNGVLVLEHLIPEADCDALKARMGQLIDGFDFTTSASIFSTQEGSHDQRDAYFLESADKIRFFYEEEALDQTGALTCAPALAINKVGHALHDLDPEFDRVSRHERLAKVATGLGLKDPLILQSMYIFKQPHIGGEVRPHQDATYLWTEPQTVVGLWLAVEDATIENGCLWGVPGDWRGAVPHQRFERTETGQTRLIDLGGDAIDPAGKVPLEAKKGTVLAFSGLFPHLSGPNRSAQSRHAYTLHIIDGAAQYPNTNWIQRSPDFPFRGF